MFVMYGDDALHRTSRTGKERGQINAFKHWGQTQLLLVWLTNVCHCSSKWMVHYDDCRNPLRQCMLIPRTRSKPLTQHSTTTISRPYQVETVFSSNHGAVCGSSLAKLQENPFTEYSAWPLDDELCTLLDTPSTCSAAAVALVLCTCSPRSKLTTGMSVVHQTPRSRRRGSSITSAAHQNRSK